MLNPQKVFSKTWTITPNSIKKIISKIPLTRQVCALTMFGGIHYYKYYKKLQKMQEWNPEKINNYQSKQIKKIINYAYENIPYYRNLFKKENIKPSQIRCTDDLKRIPILTKSEILKDPSKFISKKNKAFTTKLTGGSSGTPMSIAYDLKHYASRRATTRFFKNLAGYDDYTIRLGIPSLGPLYKTNQEFYEYNPITNQIFISSTHLSKEIFQKYINIIRKYNPQYAEGHPSVFYKFALYLKEKNITNIQLKSLQSCGEVLYPFQRDAISKTFNCEIFDFYANEEGICYASECKSHNGMHISPIMGFVEIENQKENQPGEIIATGLCNYYMPLIRYNLQDMGIITTEKCECGNSFSRLTSVIGRSNDTIILPDKTQIPPNHFTSAMEKFRFAEGFQIIQEDQKNININIVKKGKINLKETKILKKYMESLTKNQMTISINQVKDINPIGRKNKYKYIISKI